MSSAEEEDSVDSGSASPVQNDTRPAKHGRHRQHVTRACLRCRLNKVRCEGTQPCGRCASRKQECAYSKTKDGRRSRLHMKQRLTDIERENAIFHHLIDSIRDANDVQVAHIVAFVRSRASLAEIQLCLTRMEDEAVISQQQDIPGVDEAQTASDRR